MNTTLFRQFDFPNLLTLCGLALSLFAAIFAIEGHFYASILCLLYIGCVDTFDGFWARRLKRSDTQIALGGPLDSLADLCGFGFVPVIFGYCYGLRDFFSISILMLYLLACAGRLAYFESTGLQQSDGIAYFIGLPVTFAALFFPNLFVLNFFVAKSTMLLILSLIYFGMATAMVARFRIKKQDSTRQGQPRRYTLLPIGALVLTVVYGVAIINS